MLGTSYPSSYDPVIRTRGFFSRRWLIKTFIFGLGFGVTGLIAGMRLEDELHNDKRYKIERRDGRVYVRDIATDREFPIPDNFDDLSLRTYPYDIEKVDGISYIVDRFARDYTPLPKHLQQRYHYEQK